MAELSAGDRQEVQDAFRAFLGDELRYKRFVLYLNARDDLLFWQGKAWNQFCDQSTWDLGRSRNAVVTLFDGAAFAFMPRHTLSEDQVPSWCVIDSLDRQAPLQGLGSCHRHQWYFRARFGHWSIEVSDVAGPLPDPEALPEGDFYLERPYGDERYDASYMPVDEGRYFIVTSLTEFMNVRYPEVELGRSLLVCG